MDRSMRSKLIFLLPLVLLKWYEYPQSLVAVYNTIPPRKMEKKSWWKEAYLPVRKVLQETFTLEIVANGSDNQRSSKYIVQPIRVFYCVEFSSRARMMIV